MKAMHFECARSGTKKWMGVEKKKRSCLHWEARRIDVTCQGHMTSNGSQLYLMPSQSQQQRARLIQWAPTPTSHLRSLHPHPRQGSNLNLVQQVEVVEPPLSPPEKESQSACQQDMNKLKGCLWEFFAHDNVEVPTVPRDKTGQDFNHIGMARALCPRACIWDFDNDDRYVFFRINCFLTLSSSFLEKITSGEIEITADQFPNFLYDEEAADLPSDGDWDVKGGLLHSPLCLWVHTSVFFLIKSMLVFICTGLQICFHGHGHRRAGNAEE